MPESKLEEKLVLPKTITQEEKNLMKPASNIPYLVTILMMFGIGVTAVVFISILRPTSDIVVVAGVVFAFVATMTASILALMKSQETHLAVNSRLSQFIENAKQANIELGINKGVIQGTDTANARTDALNKEN